MEFIPNYLSIDFLTLVQKFKDELKQSNVFVDFDFEGSNISILMELMAYVGELNTFFINKIAKNCFLETADVYEAANRLARQIGYEPQGTRSSRGILSVLVSGTIIGDTIRVLPWKQLSSGRTTEDGDLIKFATTTSVQVTASSSLTVLSVPIRQGEVIQLTGYTGKDLIDNELILPQEYSYDDNVIDDIPTVEVRVNGDIWNRLADFYDNLIPQADNNVYMFVYDRYKRNKIIFNTSRNVPAAIDTIDLTVLKSFGSKGNIGADSGETWAITDLQFAESISGTTVSYIPNTSITVSLSAATIGAADPETIDDLRVNATAALRAQFRNVTTNDYNANLSARSDVIRGYAWGEQEIAPSGGNPQEYNIVHISVIPQQFNDSTIKTSNLGFTTDWGTSGSILIPTLYSTNWKNELFVYLRPRKMICAYEILELPELIYFTFEIGIKKKRTFVFTDIANDVLAKLVYYFRSENQQFNSIIDFNSIVEFLLDETEVSSSDNFVNIKGIRNLNIRDINIAYGQPVSYLIYPYSSLSYPRYYDLPWDNRDNTLRRIYLGTNQFPFLSSESVRITEEF
jgi:hypothetical protein